MSRSIYVIGGRITRKDTKAGIHGLHLEAWDDELCRDKFLGSDLTNRDGSFCIRFCPPRSDQHCEPCPRVYLKVRDRDCRLIYDGCADRRCCEPGTHQTIDVALPPETLWLHPFSLQGEDRDEGVYNHRAMPEIRLQALSLSPILSITLFHFGRSPYNSSDAVSWLAHLPGVVHGVGTPSIGAL